MMSQVCPIIFRNVDATVARLNTLSVTLLYVLFIATDFVPILYLLIVDFFIRLNTDKKYSFTQQVSMFIQRSLKLNSHMVDAGAKRVAAFFGLAFMIISVIFFHLNLQVSLYVVEAIFLTCTTLELVFAYCLGCQVYYLYQKLFG